MNITMFILQNTINGYYYRLPSGRIPPHLMIPVAVSLRTPQHCVASVIQKIDNLYFNIRLPPFVSIRSTKHMASNDGRTSTRLGFGKTFNLDSLGHDVRRNLVKVDPRLPEDLKNVALLLKEERNILSSLQNIAQERRQGMY